MSKSSRVSRWATALMAAGAASAMPVAHADVDLGNGVSITGFLDMSYWSNKPDTGPRTDSGAIDQFEVDFKYAGANGISLQVDIEYGEGFDGTDDETFIEQAFITKQFTEEFSVKVGRFLSYSGWETEEPTGLFQYSGTGYAPYFYGYYQNGISAAYNGSKFGVMGSVVTSAFNPTDTNSNDGIDDKFGFEVGLALTPFEGFTAKAFFISDEDTDTDIINAWVSYAIAGFTFAGEYNKAEYGGIGYDYDDDGTIDAVGTEGSGYLLMANYAAGPFGVTLRYHDFEIEDDSGATTDDGSAITFSPSYKVSDNLLIVTEYRWDKSDIRGDSETVAIEALFTF